MALVNYQLLKKYYRSVADYYELSGVERYFAWQAALRDPVKAYACYRAIVKSL